MIENILISFLSSILGVILALIFDREKYPKLDIIAGEEANSDNTYASGNQTGKRWKFFRVSVINRKIHPCLSWLMLRQTAENCRATVYIKGINNSTDFSYKGRWASTPELPHLSNGDALLKLLYYPDPVTIEEGEREILDIFTKNEDDNEAYGWNNESYYHQWRNEDYKLNQGLYKLKVVINTQNGVSSSKEFVINIGSSIEETSIK